MTDAAKIPEDLRKLADEISAPPRRLDFATFNFTLEVGGFTLQLVREVDEAMHVLRR